MSRHGLRPALRPPARRRAWLPECLRPLWREAAIYHYRWAVQEMHPLHPDLPMAITNLRAWLDERDERCYIKRGLQWL
jgi:hypothetical protein